jgi:hypothetical protein
MTSPFPGRIAKCGEHMRHSGLNVLLPTKPSCMLCLAGQSRLYVYSTITQGSKIVLGVAIANTLSASVV